MLRFILAILKEQRRRVSTLAALQLGCIAIGDLLEPIAEFTSAALLISLITLLACYLKLFRWKVLREAAREPLDPAHPELESTSLLMGASAAGCVLAVLVLGWQVATGATESGALAEALPRAAAIQERLGIVADDIHRISEDVGAIRRDVAGSKRETSTDPRKELSNLGVPWSREAMASALYAGDLRTARLFLRGGMRPEVTSDGASVALYAFLPEAIEPLGVLDLLEDEGFDLDTRLVDTAFLPDDAIKAFESRHKPEGYTAWRKTFAGNLLLWLTLWNAWDGGSPRDWAIFEELIRRGSDVRPSLGFLRANEGRLGEFGSYDRALEPLLRGDSSDDPETLPVRGLHFPKVRGQMERPVFRGWADLHIVGAAFGTFSRESEQLVFDPSPNVINRIGETFGWVVRVETEQAEIDWVEELLVAEAPASWETSGDVTVSENSATARSRQTQTPLNGLFWNHWTIGKGDPNGPAEIRVSIRGEEIARFDFQIVPGDSTRAECTRRYASVDRDAMIQEASEFNIFHFDTLGEREQLLAHLNRELLGGRRSVHTREGFARIVREVCKARHES